MTSDIRGFDIAQAEYDRQEPPSGDMPRCKCGEAYEDHISVTCEADSKAFSICPDAYANLFEEFVYEEEPEPEPDWDRINDERAERRMFGDD